MKQFIIATLLLIVPLFCFSQNKNYVKFGNIEGDVTYGEFRGFSTADKFEHNFHKDLPNSNYGNGSAPKYSGFKITKTVGPGTIELQENHKNMVPMRVKVVTKGTSTTLLEYELDKAYILSHRVYTADSGKLLEEIILLPLSVQMIVNNQESTNQIYTFSQ